MGWTHYWQHEATLPTDKLKDVLHDFQAVLANLDVKLVGADGSGEPILSEREIIFNGITGQNCEPLIIKSLKLPRRSSSKTVSYCKTEKFPYDICVQVILIILKKHIGASIAVSSDGNEDAWKQAKELCQRILDYGIDFELEEMAE